MKKIYTLAFLSLCFLFSACSKDFLESYDNRIVGTWKITDVDRVGIGGNTLTLPFRGGTFTFFDSGSLDYTNESGVLFKGSWDIDIRYRDDETLHRLQITVVDFNNQQVLSETYDDINFTGTNRFKALIDSGFHTYITYFRR